MAKAATFAAYVALVDVAEKKLIATGMKDPIERLKTLRGIYYGTTWSLDWDVESKRSVPGATVRNAGFLTYLGGNNPRDPQPAFAGTSLLADLKASQSMRDGGRNVDMGHLLIGLECRTTFTRTQAFAGQGGTGLEIVTWLGDLGGGAANLARRRAKTPGLAVDWVFDNPSSDYGVSDNLEGDIAGYVAGSLTGGDVPAITGTIAGVIKNYVAVGKGGLWNGRAESFARGIGATVGSKGVITNAPALTATLAMKLYDFGIWYASTRWVPTGELKGKDATLMCRHMKGAAEEVATVFVKTLGDAINRAPARVVATKPFPKPTPPGTCQSNLLKAASLIQVPELPSLHF
jgi:hypothetical protein